MSQLSVAVLRAKTFSENVQELLSAALRSAVEYDIWNGLV